jgi:hypothetical protein
MRIPVSSLLLPPNDLLQTVIKVVKRVDPSFLIEEKRGASNFSSSSQQLMTCADIALAIHFCNEHANPESKYQSYFKTLPEFHYFKESSPICWTEEEIDTNFGPSVISKKRVRSSKKQLADIHSKIVSEVEASPSFDSFLYAWTIISSRSFTVSSTDGSFEVEGLIPLMDMSNHKRPRDTTFFLEGASTTTIDDGYVVVQTLRAIKAGEEVCITYGAKGNSALLLSYGFCLLHNVEPDGSSNDVVTVEVKEGVECELRVGDVSYSYGCLSKAVSVFRLTENGAKDGVKSVESGNNQKDAILSFDEFEAEEEDENKGFLYDEDDSEDEDGGEEGGLYDELDDELGYDENNKGNVKDELLACVALHQALTDKLSNYRTAYNGTIDFVQYLAIISRGKDPTNKEVSEGQGFCAILHLTEAITISFYVNALDCIVEVLKELPSATEATVDEVLRSWYGKNHPNSGTLKEDFEMAVFHMWQDALKIDKLVKVFLKLNTNIDL